MLLKEIKKMADKDLRINKSKIDSISLDVPFLHNKYYKILIQEKLKQRRNENEFNSLYRKKWKYYSTEYKLTLEKREIPIYVKGDKEIIELEEKTFLLKEKILYLEAIISNINRMSFNIKNAIDFLKWTHGSG